MAIVFPTHRLLDVTGLDPAYRWEAAAAHRGETDPAALLDLAAEMEREGAHDVAARLRHRAAALRR